MERAGKTVLGTRACIERFTYVDLGLVVAVDRRKTIRRVVLRVGWNVLIYRSTRQAVCILPTNGRASRISHEYVGTYQRQAALTTQRKSFVPRDQANRVLPLRFCGPDSLFICARCRVHTASLDSIAHERSTMEQDKREKTHSRARARGRACTRARGRACTRQHPREHMLWNPSSKFTHLYLEYSTGCLKKMTDPTSVQHRDTSPPLKM